MSSLYSAMIEKSSIYKHIVEGGAIIFPLPLPDVKTVFQPSRLTNITEPSTKVGVEIPRYEISSLLLLLPPQDSQLHYLAQFGAEILSYKTSSFLLLLQPQNSQLHYLAQVGAKIPSSKTSSLLLLLPP